MKLWRRRQNQRNQFSVPESKPRSLTNRDSTEILFSGDFIERYRAGDSEAEILIWNYIRDNYIPLLRSWGFSHDDAEDICSEVNCNLLRTRCRTYDPTKAPFTAWLRIVIKNAAKYELRKRRRLACEPLSSYDEIITFANTEKDGGRSERLDLIERARKLLGESHQLVISLRFDEGLSYCQMADRLGISEPAAQMRVLRALQNLQPILEGLKVELRRTRKRARCANPSRTSPSQTSQLATPGIPD